MTSPDQSHGDLGYVIVQHELDGAKFIFGSTPLVEAHIQQRDLGHHVMLRWLSDTVKLGTHARHRHRAKRYQFHVRSPSLVSLLTTGGHIRLRGRDDLVAGRLVIDGDGDTTRGNAVRRLDPALAVSWTILHTLQYM